MTDTKNTQNFVVIDNNLIKQNKYAPLLFGLIQLDRTMRGYYIFQLADICKKLNVSNSNSAYKKIITDLLKQFQAEGIIDFKDEIKNNTLVRAYIKLPEENFTKVYDYELEKILTYSGKESKYNIFNVFLAIKSKMIDKSYCYLSYKDIKKYTGINSDTTISNIIYILSNKLKLILVANPGHRVFKNGEVKQSNNLYALNTPENENLLANLIEKYKDELEQRKIKLVKAKKANKKRSIAMKKYWKKKKESTNPPSPQVSANPPSPQDSEFGEIPVGYRCLQPEEIEAVEKVKYKKEPKLEPIKIVYYVSSGETSVELNDIAAL